MNTSTSTPVMVARILRPHALHGEVVLESLTDVEGRLENTDIFQLLNKNEESVRTVEVESRRLIQGKYVFKFAGISDRTSAEGLRGMILAVDADEIGELPPDMFFIHDLVGMKVRLQDGTEVGNVTGILKTGGVDLLEVGEKGEMLIPFTDEICKIVDPQQKIITIDPPEGLLQLNAH
ncbi:MAG TPA: ribosome maturation factor RimM [Acidobacteriota bacterium]|jgi:16S rRNA processing protein RimM|nr:ribosome maturation factor RimM [Acidobacteriota bacterium]